MSLRELRQRFQLGDRRPVLVTEVTRMSGAVCVAAYDLHADRIVRPLPRALTNWPNVEYSSGRIVVGAVLGVTPADPQPASDYPHASEDLRLTGEPARLGVLTVAEVVDALGPTADPSVAAIFGGNLIEGKYVEALSRCRSLGTIMIAAGRVRAFVNGYGKLRASVRGADGAWYDLPITDMEVQQILAQRDAAAAAQHLGTQLGANPNNQIMLRLGLARAYSGIPPQNWQPMRCYLQCNGILIP